MSLILHTSLGPVTNDVNIKKATQFISILQNQVQSAKGLLPAWGIHISFNLLQLRALPSKKGDTEFKSTAEMSFMRMVKMLLLFAGRAPQRTSFHSKNSARIHSLVFLQNDVSDQLLPGAWAVKPSAVFNKAGTECYSTAAALP